MALLIGGFAFTANAQDEIQTKSTGNSKMELSKPGNKKKGKVDSQVNKESAEAAKKAAEEAAEQQSYDLLNSQYQDAINKFEADFNKFKEGKDTEKVNLQGDMKKAEDKRKAIEKIENKLTSKQKDTFKELKEKHDRLLANYEKFFTK